MGKVSQGKYYRFLTTFTGKVVAKPDHFRGIFITVFLQNDNKNNLK